MIPLRHRTHHNLDNRSTRHRPSAIGFENGFYCCCKCHNSERRVFVHTPSSWYDSASTTDSIRTSIDRHNDAVSLDRIDTVDTEATADNLPGPGRALDKLYQIAGRKLERLLATIADRIGFGPAAAQRGILRALRTLRPEGYYIGLRSGSYIWRHATNSQKKKAEKDLSRGYKKLIRYARYVPDLIDYNV